MFYLKTKKIIKTFYNYASMSTCTALIYITGGTHMLHL